MIADDAVTARIRGEHRFRCHERPAGAVPPIDLHAVRIQLHVKFMAGGHSEAVARSQVGDACREGGRARLRFRLDDRLIGTRDRQEGDDCCD